MENKDYIFSLEIAVRDYEIDSEGIVNLLRSQFATMRLTARVLSIMPITYTI